MDLLAPVAFVNYEVQISQGLDPAGVALTAPLQALSGQLCFIPWNCPDSLFGPPFWIGGAAAWLTTVPPQPSVPKLGPSPLPFCGQAVWCSHRYWTKNEPIRFSQEYDAY